jgi:hypothetical protein
MAKLFTALTDLDDSLSVSCTVKSSSEGETYTVDVAWTDHIIGDRSLAVTGIDLDDLIAAATAMVRTDLDR